MLDSAIKQSFIELSIIILVVFVWTSLENLSKSNVTFNRNIHGSLERSYIVRPGRDTETISTQVGKVKKRISQVKATKFDFKYSAGITLSNSHLDPNLCYVTKK